MPNVQALIGWAKRHGMDNPASAAWAIAITIKRRGLPAKHVFRRAKARLINFCVQAARAAIGGAEGTG